MDMIRNAECVIPRVREPMDVGGKYITRDDVAENYVDGAGFPNLIYGTDGALQYVDGVPPSDEMLSRYESIIADKDLVRARHREFEIMLYVAFALDIVIMLVPGFVAFFFVNYTLFPYALLMATFVVRTMSLVRLRLSMHYVLGKSALQALVTKNYASMSISKIMYTIFPATSHRAMLFERWAMNFMFMAAMLFLGYTELVFSVGRIDETQNLVQITYIVATVIWGLSVHFVIDYFIMYRSVAAYMMHAPGHKKNPLEMHTPIV